MKSQIRFQVKDPFDFTLADGGSRAKRRRPTKKERGRIEEALVALGALFANTSVRWLLDGGLNVSLLAGDLVGVHQDVDISVHSNDLPKLEKWLKPRGFGLFVCDLQMAANNQEFRKVMERVNARGFLRTHADQTVLAPIDKEGRFLEREKLPFIDTHILEEVARKAYLDEPDLRFPSEWIRPVPIAFRGVTINASCAARIVYYKIYGQHGEERGVDIADAQLVAKSGKMKLSDLDALEALFSAMEVSAVAAAKRHKMRHISDHRRIMRRLKELRNLL